MRATVNPHAGEGAVPAERDVARAFHAALPGFSPTPLRDARGLAAALGLGAVGVKDESARLGLPAFKVLGASWAAEVVLREAPDTHTLVTASAGNHGRAVAWVARRRGLACRVWLPERSLPARREAIAAEGAEVVVVDGTYEDAVRLAAQAAAAPGVVELADVGTTPAAHAVIDGYATLFAEVAEQADADVLLVPVGVGSLAAAAARFGARTGVAVVGVEPASAACLTASLLAGDPVTIPTPGTAMAGMDCAQVSPAAWPSLRPGIAGTVLVTDAELPVAATELRELGMDPGECSAATVAALHIVARHQAAAPLRERLRIGPESRVVLVATEGPTSRREPSPPPGDPFAGRA
jgi:diaminopropionate ammonia-lyase